MTMAAAAAVVARGSIAGTVTGITGSAASGAKVQVYKAASGNSAGSLVKSTTASSTGTYKVSGLDDGTYLVLFANGSASYFADWYTSAPLYREADATKVTVNGAETGKNGTLQPIFSDISGSTFYGDILWLRNTGITLGCDDFHFCPSASVTRGQMAAFLVRGLDLTGDTSGDTFRDDNGSTFEDEIEILAQAGVTLGCADGLFCPDASVTRGQMAAFLVRAMDYDYNPPGDRFTDDNGSTFEDEIEKLAEAGSPRAAPTPSSAPTTLSPGARWQPSSTAPSAAGRSTPADKTTQPRVRSVVEAQLEPWVACVSGNPGFGVLQGSIFEPTEQRRRSLGPDGREGMKVVTGFEPATHGFRFTNRFMGSAVLSELGRTRRLAEVTGIGCSPARATGAWPPRWDEVLGRVRAVRGDVVAGSRPVRC